MISFVQPINDVSSGTFLGVICADAHLKWISEQLAIKKPGAPLLLRAHLPVRLSEQGLIDKILYYYSCCYLSTITYKEIMTRSKELTISRFVPLMLILSLSRV